MGLKIYAEFEPPKLAGCYGPGIWNIKQKHNGIDQNTLQCCHSQHKRSRENKKIATIFMDLPKAFDTLNHNLLVAN